MLVGVLGVDTFRIGFFADDFHFLDVARRIPLWNVLAGQHGIYPWYRPLSRELYFALVTLAGPFELFVAHALSLACVAGCAWQLRALAARASGARVAAITVALFLAYATTKFLAAWASGFQDLLALLLVLSALRAQFERRPGRALAYAFLAMFAKETAVLVFPLLACETLLMRRERADRRELLAQAGVLALATRRAPGGACELAQRRARGAHRAVAVGDRRRTRAVGRRLRGPSRRTRTRRARARRARSRSSRDAGVAGVASATRHASSRRGDACERVARALARLRRHRGGAGTRPARDRTCDGSGDGVRILCVLGSARGWRCSQRSASRAFRNSPGPRWSCCSSVGTRSRSATARRISQLAEGWNFKNWDWPEAVRLSAVSRRLADDLRSQLAARPDSLVVLYGEVPQGCFFQSEDGPATRECLRDRSVRSYWLNAPPFGVRPGRYAILTLDAESAHLAPAVFRLETRGKLTATAVACGNAAAAWAFACYGDSAENARFELHYYRAAAALMVEGVAGARREYALLGLDDTTGSAPEHWATVAFGPTGPFHAPMVAALRHPLDARAHLALADACHQLNAFVSEAVELRIATVLDPSLTAERLRLAQSLLATGQAPTARRDLEQLVAVTRDTPVGLAARRLLAGLPKDVKSDAIEASLRDLEAP